MSSKRELKRFSLVPSPSIWLSLQIPISWRGTLVFLFILYGMKATLHPAMSVRLLWEILYLYSYETNIRRSCRTMIDA